MRRVAMALVSAGYLGCGFSPTGLTGGDGGDLDGDDPVATDGRDPLDAVAPPIDGPDFDPGLCPGNYGIAVGGSRYRVRANTATFVEHYADCADDTAGLTHLVVISNGAEADALRADPAICGGGGCASFWTGLYAIDGTSFQTATREPVFARWDAGQPADFDEPPVGVTYNPQADAMTDATIDPGPDSIRALCECDGRAAETLPGF